jgi:hypothetical protein
MRDKYFWGNLGLDIDMNNRTLQNMTHLNTAYSNNIAITQMLIYEKQQSLQPNMRKLRNA